MDNDTNLAPAPSRGLHIGLWIAQIVLGLFFGAIGFMKLTQDFGGAELPEPLLRFIGLSELLGGVGLILPAATRIKPVLTPLAALGLVTVMVLAALFHLVRAEWGGIGVAVAVGAVAAFIAWGRGKKAPIAGR